MKPITSNPTNKSNTTFIHENFLLENKYAEELYHEFARDLPIIDYHCHLPPDQISSNQNFENITQIWIYGDHYKWRAMRTLGINEEFITGNATDQDKFFKWAKTVPYTMRNPLYHWTQLELARYFDEYDLLNDKSASRIYNHTSEKLNQPEFSVRSLLKKMNVETVCTTEDPTDDLVYHQMMSNEDMSFKVSTCFRPDKAILIEKDSYKSYLKKLEKATSLNIRRFDDLCEALKQRIEYFHSNGCRLSDHGLNQIWNEPFTHSELDEILARKIDDKKITHSEELKFKSAILIWLAEQYY